MTTSEPADPNTGQRSPAELLDLTGRVIVVTGAGGTVGGGIAARFDAAGATVVAHTRSTPISTTPGNGGSFSTIESDLTAAEGAAKLIEDVIAAHGRIDGLVNNAGIQPVTAFDEITAEDWDSIVATNLTAVHRLTQAAAAEMTTGSIVHIASVEGHQPAPGHAHYSTTKAAIIMHARAAAGALGPAGVRVNVVSPGLIDRPGLATDWPDGVDRWLRAAPLGRLGAPDDVGDACVFLCSDLARWITGAELIVDGGVLCRPTW